MPVDDRPDRRIPRRRPLRWWRLVLTRLAQARHLGPRRGTEPPLDGCRSTVGGSRLEAGLRVWPQLAQVGRAVRVRRRSAPQCRNALERQPRRCVRAPWPRQADHARVFGPKPGVVHLKCAPTGHRAEHARRAGRIVVPPPVRTSPGVQAALTVPERRSVGGGRLKHAPPVEQRPLQ